MGILRTGNNLTAECDKCFGLCCIALYFSVKEKFPMDKKAGQPCVNLRADFRCSVHQQLLGRGLKGCLSFDCFGAGQKVAQISFNGVDWREVPESAKKMFEVFLVMRQLHELLWYLNEALACSETRMIHQALYDMLEQTEKVTLDSPDNLLQLDLGLYREQVNILLVKTSELVREKAPQSMMKKSFRGADLAAADLRKQDLRGANLRGACLIASDLRGLDLSYADVIGVDFRDADLRGTDLTKSLFLTQAQLNVAVGNDTTRIPSVLTRPGHWK